MEQPYWVDSLPLIEAASIVPGGISWSLYCGKVSYLTAASIAVLEGKFDRFKEFYDDYTNDEPVELRTLLKILGADENRYVVSDWYWPK
jgi:hypothetical protein